MRRNVNRKVYNNRKNVSATADRLIQYSVPLRKEEGNIYFFLWYSDTTTKTLGRANDTRHHENTLVQWYHLASESIPNVFWGCDLIVEPLIDEHIHEDAIVHNIFAPGSRYVIETMHSISVLPLLQGVWRRHVWGQVGRTGNHVRPGLR